MRGCWCGSAVRVVLTGGAAWAAPPLVFGPIVEPSKDSSALWRSAGGTFGFAAPDEPLDEATVTLEMETGVPGPEPVVGLVGACWPAGRKGLFKLAVAGGVGSAETAAARLDWERLEKRESRDLGGEAGAGSRYE